LKRADPDESGLHAKRERKARRQYRMENVQIVVPDEGKPQDLGLRKKVEKS
jgi:hypothetical protein